MNHDSALPPGQQARADFPRFGLTPFAYRFPEEPNLLRSRIVNRRLLATLQIVDAQGDDVQPIGQRIWIGRSLAIRRAKRLYPFMLG